MTDMDGQETRTHCIRCGECCLKSSPTLQGEDLALLRDGFIRRRDIYTIRKGELVRDNIHGGLIPAPEEMIKIREKEGTTGGCVFYDEKEKACTIYEHRPIQCARLKCWDPADFLEVYRTPKLQRPDVIERGALLGLIQGQERKCSYDLIKRLVSKIPVKGEAAVLEILGLLKFDYFLRPLAAEKLSLPMEEADFVFGRPLIDTIVMFGLKILREPDGSFFLTRLDSMK